MSRAGTGSLPSLVIAVLFTTICPSVLAQRNFALPRLTSDPVQFRRMFVPQDNISELAKGMQTMRREEFDQRVLTAASRNASMLYPAGPRIVEAHYVATLEQDQMIGLDARLRIEHKESAPAFLLFEPCQMFLGAGEWEEAHQPARLGLDNRGRNIVVVEKSGWLRFAWSRRGNRDIAGDLVFNLAFPACPVNRLVVEVPTTIQPAITSGVVTKLENHSLPAANVGNEPSRWQIEFAGDPKAQLRFATVEPPTLESRGHFARYFHTYGVSEAGFDLQTKIYVDAMDQPARRLTLFVDPGLHMTSMKWDGSLLPAMPMSGTVTEPRRITIDLPVPATGANHELAITAVGTTPLGQPWRLPTVVAENLIWQQGRAEIHIPNTLALKQLDVSGGLQTAVNPLPSPWNGDSHGIQFSEPGGAVDINVARQPSRLSCRLGFSVTIGPTITQGLVVADLGSKHGQHFVITGLLPTDWSVDAVTADPASAMESWSLVGNSRQPSVRVHLRDAITPERGLRLRIAMHRRSRPTADSRSFRLFRIPDSDEMERLVSVRPDPPFQLRPNGDLDVRSAAIGPSEDVNARILLSPGGIAYRDDDRLAPFQVALSKDKPTYSADISIDLDVFAGLSRYDCSVRCEPQGATVNKVVVSFFGASTRTLHWSIGNQAQEFLAVRRLESGERDAAGYGDGDAYEVVLREPQSTPFTLHARQISPWTEPFQVPLVTVPEASRQRGGVHVRASDGSRPKISSTGLTQAPPSPARLGSYQVLRATFHYDPSQQATLAVRPSDGDDLAMLRVVHTHAVTQIEPDGRADHSVIYRLENTGSGRLSVQLPATGQFHRALVNNLELDRGRISGQSALEIPLPANVQFPLVQIGYTTNLGPLGLAPTLALRLPHLEAPNWATIHDIWLPPGYHTVQASASVGGSVDSLGWRFLGSLFRGTASVPFEVFNRVAWESVVGWPSKPTASDLSAYELFTSLAKDPQPTSGSGRRISRSWGELLASAQQDLLSRNPINAPRILVDAMALAEVGITPQSLVSQPAEGTYLLRGRETLHRANLALWVHPSALCITTRPVTNLCADQLESSTVPEAWKIKPSMLVGEITEALESPSFVWTDVTTWSSANNSCANWPSIALAATVDGPSNGWSGFRQSSLSPQFCAQIPIVRAAQTRAFSAFGWAACLLVVGMLSKFVLLRPWIFISLLTFLAVSVTVVPTEWVCVMRGLFYGTLLSRVVAWSARRRSHSPTTKLAISGSRSSIGRALATGATAIIFLVAIRATLAEDNTAPGAILPDIPTYPVLIPIDDQQRQTGEYLYMPRPLYDAMLRKDDVSSGAMAWLIYSANYTGALEAEHSTGQLALAQLEMNYDVEILLSGVSLQLPCGRLANSVVTAQVDGQPIVIDFEPVTGDIRLPGIRPGRHRVSVAVRPALIQQGGLRGCSLAIPRVPQSHLEITAPRPLANAIRVQSEGAIRSSRSSDERFVVELGSTDLLDLRWPAEIRRVANDNLAVDELLWIKVQPNAVVLDAKFILNPTEGGMTELTMDVEQGLRLLPSDDAAAKVKRLIINKDVQQLDWEFEQPLQGETSLTCSFALSGTSGFGHIRLPRIQVRDARIGRRWVAISLPDDLVFQPSINLDIATAVDFRRVWGDSDANPQFVFLNPPFKSWTFLTRPRDSKIRSADRMEVQVGAGFAELQFTTNVTQVGTFPMQLRFAECKGLEIRGVTLHTADHSAELPWTQDGDELRVFLERGLAEEQKFVVHARTPLAMGKEFSVPHVRIINGERTTAELLVFRRTDVIATVKAPAKESPPGQPAASQTSDRVGEYYRNKGRLLGVWSRIGTDNRVATEPVIVTTSNQPTVSGSMLTSLERVKERWWCQVEVDLNVRKGLLDTLRFEVPESLREPFDLQPACSYELRQDAAGTRREIVIRPPHAVEGLYQLRMRAEVGVNSGERFSAPMIVPLELQLEQRYVLPSQLDQGPIGWETTGLREVADQTYQAIGARPIALIKSVKPAQEMSRIPLAEVFVTCAENLLCQGMVVFNLEPAHAADCRLCLPDGVELVDVTLDGLPAKLEAVNRRENRVVLGSTALAQQLVVMFRRSAAPAASTSGQTRVQVPWIADVRVERTLITAQLPQMRIDISPLDSSIPITQSRVLLLRYMTLRRILARADELAPEGDLLTWRRLWLERIRETQLAARILVNLSGSQALSDELTDLLNYRVDDLMGLAPMSLRTSSLATRPRAAYVLFQTSSSHGSSWNSWECEGPLSAIEVRQLGDDAQYSRWLESVLVSVFVGTFGWWLATGVFSDWMIAWPESLGAVIGTVWWLALTPSILGLLIVVGCMALQLARSLRPGLRRGVSRRVSVSTSSGG